MKHVNSSGPGSSSLSMPTFTPSKLVIVVMSPISVETMGSMIFSSDTLDEGTVLDQQGDRSMEVNLVEKLFLRLDEKLMGLLGLDTRFDEKLLG
jgi:hypothetical protein